MAVQVKLGRWERQHAEAARNHQRPSENLLDQTLAPSTSRADHLPRIELPHFNGSPTEWLTFKGRFEKRMVTIKFKKINVPCAKSIMSLIDAVDTTVHAAKQIQKDKTATLDCVANGMLVSLAKSRLDSETASRLEERLDIHRVYTWTEFKEELEKRANQLACRTDIDESKSRNTKTVAAAAITQPQRREIKTQPQSCFACNEKGHAIWHCTEFKALPVPQRWDRTKRAGRCFNCLSWGHSVQKCSSKKRCSECGEAHHTLLHPVDAVPEKKPAADPAVVASTSTEINIKGASDWYRVRRLLDSGSQVESITEAAAQTLGLPYARSDVQLVGIGGRVNASRKITTVISSRCGSFAMEVSLVLVPHLLDDQPSIRLEAKDVSVPSNIELADPTFYKRRGIEIILGARVLFQILSPRQIQCTNGPNLQESALGWLVGGLVSLRSTRKAVMTVATVSTNEIQEEEDPDGKLDILFKRFWALEEVTSAEAKSTSDQPIQLGDSYEQARRRLFSLERKLTRTPEVYEQYREFLKEYLTLNHMEVVEPKDYQKIRYFIPHSCVIKPDSSSTKLRVVFDASAKASNGHSLNDMLRSGPAIQTEQFDLLLDFRCHDKVLMADIAKMYRQVHVHETDSWYQCIAWRDNPSEAIQAYRLKTVTYGEAASSFLACRALHQVGEEIRSHQPSIADIIQKCFYVDNLMMGGNSAEGLLSQRKAVEAALLQRGFPLRKWASNDASIIEDVPADDLEKEINIGNHDVIKTPWQSGPWESSQKPETQFEMWPFTMESPPEVAVENNISTHNIVGYSVDALFIIAAIIIVIVWRWRRNARRLKQLEGAATKLRQQTLNNSV
ncbi:uncharacterized protein LOC129742953 [Uranotaenia lowii]|uniref:uncharacterized protein LOC129742953 n=1 Tax=Uranotaenia lowii TaxID=190385 RepID=UPI0024792F4F|nr:uncharacterized protein LOC129742953 [Uranotaenia lowii]